jgi:hypothetical protein
LLIESNFLQTGVEKGEGWRNMPPESVNHPLAQRKASGWRSTIPIYILDTADDIFELVFGASRNHFLKISKG